MVECFTKDASPTTRGDNDIVYDVVSNDENGQHEWDLTHSSIVLCAVPWMNESSSLSSSASAPCRARLSELDRENLLKMYCTYCSVRKHYFYLWFICWRQASKARAVKHASTATPKKKGSVNLIVSSCHNFTQPQVIYLFIYQNNSCSLLLTTTIN